MGRFLDLENKFRCFREEIGAMLEFNFFKCWRAAPANKLRQLADLVVLYTRHGFLPESYYNYRLYEPKIPLKQRVSAYVSDKDRYRQLGKVNTGYGDVLRNKWLFHTLYGAKNIPTPEYYGNFQHKRGSWQDGSPLRSAPDIAAGCKAGRYPSFVAKPVFGSGGNRVLIFPEVSGGSRLQDSFGKTWTPEELAEYIGARDYIFEAKVEQHPTLKALYPYSLNTVRIVTLFDGKEVVPWTAVLRAGTRASGAVDNWGRGGLSIAVEPSSGKMGKGVVSVKHLGDLPEFMAVHPDSGWPFTGEILPNWEQVLATAEKAAKVVPGLPYVAWDVAITPEGCCIIEGNHRPDVNLLQVHGGLLRNETCSRWWQEQFAPLPSSGLPD